MKHTPVRSSNLASVGYDAATNTLEIKFCSGGVYQYATVPESVYSALMEADSLGKYFYRHIRDRYLTTRIH